MVTNATYRNRRQITLLVFLIMLVFATGCQSPIEVTYSCEGTVSGATVWYTGREGTIQEEIILPWQQTVYLSEKSNVPELKVEIPDEQKEINCNIHTEGDTGSSAAVGPEIVVKGASSGE
jgi:hypothetical protein